METIIPRLADLFTIFLSLLIESFPFVVLGVSISSLIGVFLKEDFLLRRLPKNNILRNLILSISGVILPVCECGNLPVARRLLLNNLNVSNTITFLLAAPIINPITFLTTWEAFSFDRSVAITRIIAAFLIANIIGFIINLHKNQEQAFLTNRFYQEVCHHDHVPKGKSKLIKLVRIFRSEFILVFKAMLIGAFIAASFQIFIPREVLVSVGSNPVLSVISMLIIAFVVSICANVDAFFALSYVNTFSIGSILTFLTFGPMIDIKMLAMMRTTFKKQFLIMLSILVALLSVITGLLINLIV